MPLLKHPVLFPSTAPPGLVSSTFMLLELQGTTCICLIVFPLKCEHCCVHRACRCISQAQTISRTDQKMVYTVLCGPDSMATQSSALPIDNKCLYLTGFLEAFFPL